MAAVIAEPRPRLPRSEQNTPAAFLLALSMHALLVGALWISVQWRTEPAGAVVVELWGSAPVPAPEPIAVPPPAPLPAPPKVEPRAEQPKPDIAFKEEKKPPPDTTKIEAEKQRAAEEARRVKAEQQQRERELELKKQREFELKKQELEQKKQRELEQKKQAEATRAAEQKRDDERRVALRKSEETRVLAQAGGGTAAGNSGGTPGSGGRGDAGYGSMLAALIKPRIVFAVPDGTASSTYADFDVDLLPTGEILRVRLVRSSGLPGYDAAVERAIRRTDPFPRKADGTVDRTVALRFFPVEK